MTNLPEHPITTPKGAAAVSIVLAVFGAFTPFFVDLRIAVFFAALCFAVIVWLYAAEFRKALVAKTWHPHLLVPTLSIVAIVGIGLISVTAKKAAPSTSEAPADRDVTRRLDEWLERHQPRESNTTPTDSASPPPPVIIRLEPDPIIPERRPAPTIAPKSDVDSNFNDDLKAIIERSRERQKLSDAYYKCKSASYSVSGSMIKLVNQAINYQNGWAYSRDDRELLNQYQRWIGAVGQLISENKGALKDVSRFEEVKELPVESGFLVARNVLGENVWRNFDAKREGLDKIRKDYEASVCSSEEAAMKAPEAKRAAQASGAGGTGSDASGAK